jgi:very-short-patch-repair endonuclease
VEPQVQLGGWRVDFLVYAPDWTPGAERWRWREPLIIECDGHDFHERTKEQAAKDRSRDRAAVLAGREVFRFTGSELWRNPWGCAEQVFDWAERGL